MPDEQTASKTGAAPPLVPLNDQAVAFLTQEMDRMLALYTQAQSNAQSVFNFYLTFVTTVVGAVVVLLQLSPSSRSDAQLIIAGLMLFAAIVGSVYLSALSGRYAHAGRFARAVDDIRRYLIERLHVPVPPLYQPFMTRTVEPEPRGLMRWVIWLIPTGTYQMFIAIVNSAALSIMTWLIGVSTGITGAGRMFAASAAIFLITLTIYNVYSRLVIRIFGRNLHVRIDIGSDLALWAAKE